MKAKSLQTIHWTLLEYNEWKLYLAATENGLCFVGSHNKPFAEVLNWAEKRIPGNRLIQDDKKLQPYVNEISEYLQGKRRIFSVPSDYYGTDFQMAVWNALCKISYGETMSYSQIAESIHKPAAARAVGAAIGANPLLITVPCHRAIGKNGKLTGYRGGLGMKEKLLNLEQSILK